MRLTHSIVAAGLVAALATGCGDPGGQPEFESYDEAAFAGALCVDTDYVRVPDNYCPIGDRPVEGHPYFWAYQEYSGTELDIDVVYLGYPVDRTRWTNVRPPRVATTNIDRGSFPERPAPGAAPATAVRVESAPVRRRNSEIQRGGLGVSNARAARPTGTPVAASAGSAPAPRAVPAPPKGKRPVAPPSGRKKGRK